MNFEAISPGDKVLITRTGWHTLTFVDEVERLTKTQIITKKNGKFNRRLGYGIGNRPARIIKIATAEDIYRLSRAGRISKLNGELVNLVNVSHETLHQNLDRIISIAMEIKQLKG